MAEYYVTKLNVEPSVLDLYEEKNLIGKVIPDSLDKLFHKISESEGIIKYEFRNDIDVIIDSDLYANILTIKELLIGEYYKVVSIFQKTGEIRYSKNYMSYRSQLKEKIDELFSLYPFLKSSEEIKLPSFSKGKVSEIQMGVTYIDRATKIETFLSDTTISDSVRLVEFCYDTSNERIYIPETTLKTENIVNELNSVVNEIQDKINIYQNETDIGQVSINIIYENFEIKAGKYKEVTITRVFPNGNPALDRGKAMRAARVETKYRAAQGESFSEIDITEESKEDAEVGYIASIISRKKNIIENKIKKIFIRED